MKIKWFTDAGCPGNSIKRLLALKFAIILTITIPFQSHASSDLTESSLENDLTSNPIQQTVTGTVSDATGPLP
ncbi:hypothetical protein [Zobellia laminariae]|uniref:hypothetical protein n=1 Tax=Zobellia laminariae TaxID=248906 RepID=UPI0026F45EA0|nr:hypothetical protein [Zobellia laminariae]WKX76649.1 hypothetical protein Q5W13_00235 [Zobellia laminariae]